MKEVASGGVTINSEVALEFWRDLLIEHNAVVFNYIRGVFNVFSVDSAGRSKKITLEQSVSDDFLFSALRYLLNVKSTDANFTTWQPTERAEASGELNGLPWVCSADSLGGSGFFVSVSLDAQISLEQYVDVRKSELDRFAHNYRIANANDPEKNRSKRSVYGADGWSSEVKRFLSDA